MYEMLIKGGPLMWPIALCSVVSLALAILNGWRLVRLGEEVRGIVQCGEVRQKAANTLDVELNQAESSIEGIALVATTAPLLGLTGTVFGMIDTFRALGVGANMEASLLAKGIWEALLTTAAGLVVAIIAHIFHHTLQRRAETLRYTLEKGPAKGNSA